MSFENLEERRVFSVDYFVNSLTTSYGVSPMAGGNVRADFSWAMTGNEMPSVEMGFYLSRDQSISTSDRPLTSIRVQPGMALNLSVMVPLPGLNDPIWSGDGVYYLGIIVDPSNQVVETDEANNSNRGLTVDWQSVSVVNTQSGNANRGFKSLDGNARGDLIGFYGAQIWAATSDGTRLNNALWGQWSNQTIWDYQSTGDFNGDGRTDIVGFTESGSWWVGISTGTSFVSSLWGIWADQDYRTFVVGDFNGDGKDDIAARSFDGKWLMAGSTGSSFLTTESGTWDTSTTWFDTTVGDVNGDKRMDIVSRSLSGQWVANIGLNNGQFITVPWGSWSSAVYWADVQVGDLNGDGADDIVGRTTGGQFWVARSTGAGTFNELWATWSPAVIWMNVTLADVQGTGRKSLVGRTEYGQWWVGLSNGSRFVTQYWGAWDSARVWRDVHWTDVNGDGRADMLGRTYGQWWVARSTGTGFINAYMGAWAQLPWARVQGTGGSTETILAMSPTSEYTPGYVTQKLGEVLIGLASEQIATLSYAQAQSAGAFNFNQSITQITAMRQGLIDFNNNITRITSGLATDIPFGGPEGVINRQTLRNTDRMLMSIPLWTDGPTGGSGTGEGERPPLDLAWPAKIGAKLYMDLRNGIEQQTSTVIDRVGTILGPIGAPIVGLTHIAAAAVFVGLDAGVSIVQRRNAVPADFLPTINMLLPNVGRAINMYNYVRKLFQQHNLETPNVSRSAIETGAANQLKQLDASTANTTFDQIENKFAQLNSILLNRTTNTEPNPNPDTNSNWWQGAKSFTVRDAQGNTATVNVVVGADKKGTISLSGYYTGAGSFNNAVLYYTGSKVTGLASYPASPQMFHRADNRDFPDVGFSMSIVNGKIVASLDRMTS